MTKRIVCSFLLFVLSLGMVGCLRNLPGKITSTAKESAAQETPSIVQPEPQSAEPLPGLLPGATPIDLSAATSHLMPETRPIEAGKTFSNAWEYCHAVGTIDAIGAEYTGEKVPSAIRSEILSILRISAQDGGAHEILWRCVDDQVMACDDTVETSCLSKIMLDTHPNEAMNAECAKPEMDQKALSKQTTGKESAYTWICADKKPQIASAAVSIDFQGYNAEIWYPVMQP